MATLFACSWSLLNSSFFQTHDYTHGARIVEMLAGLQEGQLPVRWAPDLGYGFGMPLFQFYAPLPYFIGALIYWTSKDLVWSIKLLILLSNLGTLVGGYYLGKNILAPSKLSGLVLAAAITLAPYRALNLFIRGAISEVWGIMFFPWILLLMIMLIKSRGRKSWEWLFLALAFSGLFLSHNLMTMVFIPISLGLAVVYSLVWFQADLKRQLLPVLSAIFSSLTMAIGLSAFYLLPSFLEKDGTQVEAVLGGYFHYSQHFIYLRQFLLPNWGYGDSRWGPDDGISFFLGWGQLLGLAVITLWSFWLIGKKIKGIETKNSHRQQALVMFIGVFGFLALTLFMSLLRSKPIWDLVSTLQYLQFPWRFIGVGLVLLAVLLSLGVHMIVDRRLKLLYGGVVIVLTFASSIYFHPASFLEDASAFYYADKNKISSQMSGVLPEFIPKQLDVVKAEKILPDKVLSIKDMWLNEEELAALMDVKVIENKGHTKQIQTNFSEPTALGFKVASYPGWKLEIDGQEKDWDMGELGNIQVVVPAYPHHLHLFLGKTNVRLYSDGLSALSALFLGIFLVKKLCLDSGVWKWRGRK